MQMNPIAKWILITLWVAALVAVVFYLKDCSWLPEPKPAPPRIESISTSDTLWKHDTVRVPFPVYRIQQVPKIVIEWRDRDSNVTIDTSGIDSLRKVLQFLSFTASTDTTVTNTITTKYGSWTDTLHLSSIYLFPANTASFVIKRNDFNYDHLIQTIINNTKTTTYEQLSFWDKLQYAMYGAAAALAVREVLR